MCGIIGYVGHRDASARLVEALEALEYRGYDSAGICLLRSGRLDITRAVGKLRALKDRLAERDDLSATTGIGHTRWATHGAVTETNAHPLRAGHHDDVAIVLNGIVENHQQLRDELAADGELCASQTDAEVVSHLVRRAYRGSLAEAVREASRHLEGHFAFLAVHRDQPGLVVGTRRRCPLLVGIGDGETALASSISAFSGWTRRVQLIEDGEVVAITAERARIVDATGRSLRRRADIVPAEDADSGRNGHETYMLKEIHEQPDALNATIARNLREGAQWPPSMLALDSVGARDLRDFHRVTIVACGTAYHAGLAGRLAIEQWADLPCQVEVASEWRYSSPRVDDRTLVVAISQSGETADTLAALDLANRLGGATLAITNTPGSQVTREADAVLHTYAGIEIGVAATKTFTSQLAVLYLLALRLGRARSVLTTAQADVLTQELRSLPAKLRACLDGLHGIEELAERFADSRFFLFLGRHAGLPVCLEGALKLKEIAYIPCEAYAAGEMKHGPIALLDAQTPVVCVATASPVADKLQSNLQEVRARGAQLIAIATAGDTDVHRVAQSVIEVPASHPLLAPVLAVVPLQVLSYHLARHCGFDVDQPRNLAKTVTVE